MTETTRQRWTPRGDHRILYVSDPSTVARTSLPDPVQEEDLRRWVDMVADSGVDLFDQEVFSQGWTAYWQSDRYQYDQRHLIPADAIRRTAATDAPPVRGDCLDYVRKAGGRRFPCIPEQGWFDFREDPGPAFSTRWFSLSSSITAYGENCLSVTLLESDPGARQPNIIIDELEAWVEPR